MWFMKVIVCNCSCGKNYVGESVTKVVLRWGEHGDSNWNKQSETAKQLKYFPNHQFEWKVLTGAPECMKKKKENFRSVFN